MTPPVYYCLRDAKWRLQFSAAAQAVLSKHVQVGLRSKESVGQLFSSDLTVECIIVDVATVLKPTLAAWSKVRFNTARAIAEREAMFQQGLHCIGLWHTHPEIKPEPSPEDRAVAREYALAARSLLTGLVFAIVGTRPMPIGMRVWVDDGQQLREALLAVGSETRPELSRPD